MNAPCVVSPDPGGLSLFDAGALAAARIAVVIPARDEEALIGRCLAALAPQLAQNRAGVVLVVNNTSDQTAARAIAVARDRGLPLALWAGAVAQGGVGMARSLGVMLAQGVCPQASVLLCTDADAQAAPGWIAGMARALRKADAVTGRIDIFEDEAMALPAAFHADSEKEARYIRLTRDFDALLDPAGRGGRLNTAGGANIGFRCAAYQAVGGFRPLVSGEDRDLFARCHAAGYRIAATQDATVRVSLRAEGRAPGGMADVVAARLAGRMAVDSALRPLGDMLNRHLRTGSLSPGRPDPDRLIADTEALAACVEALRACPSLAARRRYARQLLTQLRGAVCTAGGPEEIIARQARAEIL